MGKETTQLITPACCILRGTGRRKKPASSTHTSYLQGLVDQCGPPMISKTVCKNTHSQRHTQQLTRGAHGSGVDPGERARESERSDLGTLERRAGGKNQCRNQELHHPHTDAHPLRRRHYARPRQHFRAHFGAPRQLRCRPV